jgi:hypothetical protein
MHGQFPHSLDEKLVDKEQSYQWLKFGDIKGETESTIVAAQDQAISTNYLKRIILKERIESRCQLCKGYEETRGHLTSGCPILAKNEYIIRHNKVCTHLHYLICKTLGIETTENWYSTYLSWYVNMKIQDIPERTNLPTFLTLFKNVICIKASVCPNITLTLKHSHIQNNVSNKRIVGSS